MAPVAQGREPTVLGYLTPTLTQLQSLMIDIRGMQADVSNAYQLAVQQGKPTVQIRFFQDELDALYNIVGEQILPMVQKLAEVEAGSKG